VDVINKLIKLNNMCATRKCGNSSCNTHLQTCQMIQGMCPACYQAKQNEIKTTTNVPNQTKINKQ